MNSQSYLPFVAAAFSAALALAVAGGKRKSFASWSFATGMVAFALQYAFCGILLAQVDAARVIFWHTLVLSVRSVCPVIWLCFSLAYSRGNYREFLARWRIVLIGLAILPLGLTIAFHRTLITRLFESDADQLWVKYSIAARPINILVLIGLVLILMNLEKTFRSAVGIMRWRIKFMVIGLGLICIVKIYNCSQVLLFSAGNFALAQVDAGALIIGGSLIVVGYFRRGLTEAEIYPSHAVLENSITVMLSGGYLFVVGVLSQLIGTVRGAGNFEVQAFVILLGIAGLATLLFSERARHRLRSFVSRHFKRPNQDFRKVWTLLTDRMSTVLEKGELCARAAGLISENFNALSVTIWLIDPVNEGIVLAASTSHTTRDFQEAHDGCTEARRLGIELCRIGRPFDLATADKSWAEALNRVAARQFRAEGTCICVPLIAKGQCMGVAMMTDRVYNSRYTAEEFELLKCIGDHVAAALLNLRFSDELLANKEVEAFQTMSVFLVHDLKNAASALGLTVRNLPVHFDNPAFREDALRSISSTVNRMNHLIERLNTFRHRLEIKPTEADLNQLIRDALAELTDISGVEIVHDLGPLPKLIMDKEQVQSVVTNLILNARDAVGEQGRITVKTSEVGGAAVLSVADNGCGMTPEFMRDSLFRPFRTTKKKGLGIGIFQSKTIIEAHHGSIHVESEPGRSTTFRVSLPIKPYTA